MNRERLSLLESKLSRFKETRHELLLPPGKSGRDVRFEMDVWVRYEPTCGTAACAWGFAGLHPEFQAMGLKPAPMICGRNSMMDIWFANRTGFMAAAAFFEIEYETAMYIFNPDYYSTTRARVTPEVVANRINDILEEGEPTLDRIQTHLQSLRAHLV